MTAARPRFSVLIPARNEEALLPACLESIATASRGFEGQVEVIVAVNRSTDRTEEIARASGAVVVRDESKCMAKIRNAAARASTGEILLTIDADSRMSLRMIAAVEGRIRSGRYVGGGVLIVPERWSFGIAATGLVLFMYTFWRRIYAGMFWCRREDFEAVGGFDESLTSAEDIDFAKRLGRYGRRSGRRFGMIWRAHIVTSCRKFDRFGEWHLFTRLPAAIRLLGGRSARDADPYYYDVPR